MPTQLPTAGDDLIDARDETVAVNIDGGAGNDTIYGSAFDDVLTGGDGSDAIDGGAGDDRIIASSIDTIKGGAGRDTLVAADDLAWNIDLASGDIEVVFGGGGADVILGNTQSVAVELVYE